MRHKGTVFESSDNWAILLMPGGEFKKVKTKHRLHIGQMYAPVARAVYRPMVAAAVLIVTLAFSANFLTVAAWARLSPGVELGVNSWGRVISIKTQGVQGENLTAGMPMWGKNIEEVLPVLLERTVQQVGNAQQENIVVKVEAQGGYWPRGQSGLDHINKSLHKYNESNSQNRLVKQEDRRSWLWQKYSQPASKNGEEQSNTSKVAEDNDQGMRKERPKTKKQSDFEKKGNNNRNSSNSGDNNRQGNNDSSNSGTDVGDNDNQRNANRSDKHDKNDNSHRNSRNNSDNNRNDDNKGNDDRNNNNDNSNNGHGSKHANKPQQSEKDQKSGD